VKAVIDKRLVGKIAVTLSYVILVMGLAVIIALPANDLPADASPIEGIEVPILMYHRVLKDSSKVDTYTITPGTFRNDMIYLMERGYETVFIKDIIDYAMGGAPLPAKPVVITFDDGYYNNYIYVLPILEELGIKASIAAVGEFTDTFTNSMDMNANYSHLTWGLLKELEESGHVEILNHSYYMHKQGKRNGVKRRKGEDEEEYRSVLTFDVMKMQEQLRVKAGITPQTFVYPYGLYTDDSEELLKEMGFKATLICEERINFITGPESLYKLGRFNRTGKMSTERFMAKMGIK
jgi:peptidoglycan/xylan/chitin deacetylase (PgdA/CDA1 family)